MPNAHLPIQRYPNLMVPLKSGKQMENNGGGFLWGSSRMKWGHPVSILPCSSIEDGFGRPNICVHITSSLYWHQLENWLKL
eukprot:270778-Ditylum_brightwellii.AAC.1